MELGFVSILVAIKMIVYTMTAAAAAPHSCGCCQIER